MLKWEYCLVLEYLEGDKFRLQRRVQLCRVS